MAAIRAAANGLSVAQSANGGDSAALDPQGRFMVYGRYGAAGTIDAWLPLSR